MGSLSLGSFIRRKGFHPVWFPSRLRRLLLFLASACPCRAGRSRKLVDGFASSCVAFSEACTRRHDDLALSFPSRLGRRFFTLAGVVLTASEWFRTARRLHTGGLRASSSALADGLGCTHSVLQRGAGEGSRGQRHQGACSRSDSARALAWANHTRSRRFDASASAPAEGSCRSISTAIPASKRRGVQVSHP